MEEVVFEDVPVDLERPMGEEPVEEEVGSVPQKSSPKLDPEEYAAVIEVTDTIKLGSSGTLNGWVGKEKYIPKANKKMVRDTTSWYSCGEEFHY